MVRILNHFGGSIIIALLKITTVESQNNSLCVPAAKDCSFYSRCLEARVHCGLDGYPIGYGLYYCDQFQMDINRFSPQGQQWIWSTMWCLETDLIDVANGEVEMNCTQIRDYAFSTHPICYTQPGASICNIPPTDWVQLFIIIYKQLDDPQTWKQMLQVGESCGALYFQNVIDAIDSI